MRRYFLFLVICLISFSAQAQSSTDTISFEKLFVISPEFESPGHFLRSNAVSTDSEGNIFVSDSKRNKVHMYDSEGDYKQSFGGQGRGPGEFNQITDIAINNSDQLLVLDRMSFKMSKFDIPTEDIEEQLFEDLDQLNMFAFSPLSGDRFAAVYPKSAQTKEHQIDNQRVIRVYKFGNGTREDDFLDIYEHRFDRDKPVEAKMASGLGYQLTALDNTTVALVPRVYDGRIFTVNTETGDITETSNSAITEPHYIQFEDDPTEDESSSVSGVIRSFGPTGSFYYQVVNNSKLLEANDQHLFHIIEKYEPEGTDSALHIEVYSKDGELKLFQNAPELSKSDEEVRFQQFLHIGDDNRLFVANIFDERDPEIEVYRIKVQ